MNASAAKPDLKSHLAANPGAVIEDVARDFGVTPRTVLENLPNGMAAIGGGEGFVEIMNDTAGWGDLTVIIHTADGIFEYSGTLPRGEIGHGYFNLMSPTGLHGHLRHARCGGVAFVERSFRGKASAFIALLNVDGGIMFKIFVGRDAARDLKQDQLAKFTALRSRFAASGRT